MQIDGIAVVFRQGAHCVQHTAVLKRIGRGQVLVQLGVLLMGCAGRVPMMPRLSAPPLLNLTL